MNVVSDETVEIASRAAYASAQKVACKYYAGTMLDRFVPWEAVSKEWRDDYKKTIQAALMSVRQP